MLGEQCRVVKPVVRLDAPATQLKAASFDDLIQSFEMLAAPPGVHPPDAIVSKDFQRNVQRLLVLVPSAGAPPGTWDVGLGPHGDTNSLLRWAEANSYAVAIFAAQALEAKPAEVWDRVLRGSPARCVSVAAVSGSLPLLQAALAPLHPVLYSRFRTLCVVQDQATSNSEASASPTLPAELQSHLANSLVRLPASWAEAEPFLAHQQLFEVLLGREELWQKGEARKYAGFQGLKENDMPGLRRIGLDQRVSRLDRDRHDDELARLLKKNERANQGNDEDEPGVD